MSFSPLPLKVHYSPPDVLAHWSIQLTKPLPRYRRYTELPSLIHTLTHFKLTLLDPRSWDDKNDSNFLALYREKLKLKSVLALCFTPAQETYHHWKVFSPGSAGVCISFEPTKLRAAAKKIPDLQIRPVEYLTLKNLDKLTLRVQDLPFLKRAPYRPEKEIRFLWESRNAELDSLSVAFERAAITRVTLSPWMHHVLAVEVKTLLRSIPGWSDLKIVHSTLVNNETWLEQGKKAK